MRVKDDGGADDREATKPSRPDKQRFTWGLLVALLTAGVLLALALAYLITRHNFPAR